MRRCEGARTARREASCRWPYPRHRREPAMRDARAIAGPPRDDPRLMIERHNRELVGRIEQVDDESLHGRACVLNAAAEHAVARIDQDPEADRDALPGELRHRLRFTVLVDVERVTG